MTESLTVDFSNHPPSITELKANRDSDGTLWTPRDALISLLREIDSGLDVGSVVISYKFHVTKEDRGVVRTITAAPTRFEALGMLCASQHQVYGVVTVT